MAGCHGRVARGEETPLRTKENGHKSAERASSRPPSDRISPDLRPTGRRRAEQLTPKRRSNSGRASRRLAQRSPRSRERSSFDDCSGLDRSSFQSVETRGREQVEVESRDGARGDHEGEHDGVIRPPRSDRVVALDSSQSVEAVTQGALLTSSGRRAAPTVFTSGGGEPGLPVPRPSGSGEAESDSCRRSKTTSAWRAIASSARPKPVRHENLPTW
jgi:hypothetical protein